MIFILCYSCTT